MKKGKGRKNRMPGRRAVKAGAPEVEVYYKKRTALPYDVKSRVSEILEAEGAQKSGVRVVFVDDVFIKRMNAGYRNKNAATDVITFEENGCGGDIYISVETAKRNARQYGIPYYEEAARLVIHGVLHSLGYDHMNSRDEREMNRKTERYVRFFLKGAGGKKRPKKENSRPEVFERARGGVEWTQ